jgi:hypothetical protein
MGTCLFATPLLSNSYCILLISQSLPSNGSTCHNIVTCKSIARQHPQHIHDQQYSRSVFLVSVVSHTTVLSNHVTCVFCRSSQHTNGLAGYRSCDMFSVMHVHAASIFLSCSSKQQQEYNSKQQQEYSSKW